MESSVQTSHSKDNDISSESNGEEELTTLPTAQRSNAPPADDQFVVNIRAGVGDAEGDVEGDAEGDGEGEDGEEQENENEEQERNNNAMPRSSMEGNRSYTGAPTQDHTDNTTDPRSNHGVEPEPNPNPDPAAENQSSILFNCTFIRSIHLFLHKLSLVFFPFTFLNLQFPVPKIKISNSPIVKRKFSILHSPNFHSFF